MFYTRNNSERTRASNPYRCEGSTDNEKRQSVKHMHLKSKPEKDPHNLRWGTRSSISKGNQRSSAHVICIENQMNEIQVPCYLQPDFTSLHNIRVRQDAFSMSSTNTIRFFDLTHNQHICPTTRKTYTLSEQEHGYVHPSSMVFLQIVLP